MISGWCRVVLMPQTRANVPLIAFATLMHMGKVALKQYNILTCDTTLFDRLGDQEIKIEFFSHFSGMMSGTGRVV